MDRSNNQPMRSRYSSGVTLIEVLVALLVLSIGLIGVAALQANALQANHGSQMRSQATNLAYDIADRMRANRQAALSTDNDYVGDYSAINCPSDPDNLPSPAGNLAQRDVAEWRVALACGMPNGRARITRDGDEFTIRIRWDNDRLVDDDSEEVEEFITRTEI